MITWLTLKQQISGGFLKDPLYSKYDEDQLLWAVNDALVALASSYAGVVSVSDVVGDGTTTEWPLPSNVVEGRDRGVFGIRWTDGKTWLRELDYQPGAAEDSTNTYAVWPTGTINLYAAPRSGTTFKLFYIAYYNRVEDDNSVIDIPDWAYEAVKCYVAASVLAPSYAQQALLGNYKKKRDSGNPEDNPQLRLSQYFLKRYHTICQQHPQEQYRRMGARR